MNSRWSGIVAANHRTSIHETLLIWTGHAKVAEIDDETLCPEVASSISTRPPGGLEPNARGRGRSEVLEQEIRVKIGDFVPDFNFDWSIFRKENIRLTTARRKPKVCRQSSIFGGTECRLEQVAGRDD